MSFLFYYILEYIINSEDIQHDPSKLILIWWFGDQVVFHIISVCNVVLLNIFVETVRHLSEIEIFCNNKYLFWSI